MVVLLNTAQKTKPNEIGLMQVIGMLREEDVIPT